MIGHRQKQLRLKDSFLLECEQGQRGVCGKYAFSWVESQNSVVDSSLDVSCLRPLLVEGEIK